MSYIKQNYTVRPETLGQAVNHSHYLLKNPLYIGAFIAALKIFIERPDRSVTKLHYF